MYIIWIHIVSYGFIWILYKSSKNARKNMESLAPWVNIWRNQQGNRNPSGDWEE